jgi:hypothetical protein
VRRVDRILVKEILGVVLRVGRGVGQLCGGSFFLGGGILVGGHGLICFGQAAAEGTDLEIIVNGLSAV